MLSQYNGQFVYACRFFGKRLNINENTFSLCHEAQVGDQILGLMSELSVEQYDKAVSELIERNFNADAPCRKCDKCKKMLFQEQRINYVPISISTYCNSRCIYCGSHFGKKGEGGNPIPYLEEFEQRGKFAQDCFFDWGGGEPTLSPFFEETVNWIAGHRYRQRINTNAILYSESTEQALKEGQANLRISVDSGSKECFFRMKGHEKYEAVWENIARYRKASDEIYLKYNICNYNSDFKEIDKFLDNCRKAGINKILIDAEVSAYQPQKNVGPFYFTEKEFTAAHYMEKQAEERGFTVGISPFAYSVRGEYNENGKLMLPSKYYDNIDRSVISNGIFAETFPTMECMAKTLQKHRKDIVIWGAGDWGREITARLIQYKIRISAIVDRNPDLWGTAIGDVYVESTEKLFCQKKECILILASRSAVEMLREVNERDYKCAVIYWIRDIQTFLQETEAI